MRNQEKLLKKKKKSRSRFGRFVLTLLLVIVFLVLAFYFLNNPSAYAGLKNKITSIFTSESTDANGQSNTEATDANGNTIATSGQDSAGTVSGTSATDSSGNDSQSTDAQTASGTSAEEQTTSKNQGASGSVAGAAQSFWQKIIAFFRQKMGSQADNFPGTINMKIYFAALGQDEVFSFEERLINAGSPRVAVENTVNELLKGPSKSFHYPVIPPGTKLLGVQIYENLAKIDLSQEFLENSLESGILDDYVIYTIVDTVTQIPGVEGVIFLIDGKRIKLYGSVDISIPAIKNEKYIPVESSETTGSS